MPDRVHASRMQGDFRPGLTGPCTRSSTPGLTVETAIRSLTGLARLRRGGPGRIACASRFVVNEMHLQLDQARNGPLNWREDVPVTAADSGRDEALVLGAVDCKGSLTLVGPDFLLEARLRYRQRLYCNRCLTACEENVELPLVLVVTSCSEEASPAGNGAGALELEPEDLSTLTAVGGEIDLAVLVRDQVELNVPMKPICEPGCPGLCPRCGADRKLEACACAAQQFDPRWSGLEALRGRLGEESA